jgi:hypothetical protein
MTLHNLGALNKSQVHFDTSLKATDRLTLVETALEYLEEAWAIRKAELGDEHPHTIATRSSFGSTLAAQVLYQHKLVERSGDSPSTQRQYVALNSHIVTEHGWDAAEKHLRESMETAKSNPRGKSIITKNKKSKTKKGKDDDAMGVQTLSAAAAAQNLAVFLKSRAMTENPYNESLMAEAQQLYNQVTTVRSQLLPAQHPDVYATKYSLAELLESIGDKEAANALRQEIIDTYDPPASSQGESAATSLVQEPLLANEQPREEPRRPKVVVERTAATKM